MRASCHFQQLMLRGISWDASQAGWSLLDALEVASRGTLDAGAKMPVLVSTTTDGRPVRIMLPPVGDLTSADVVVVAETLLARARAILAEHPGALDGEVRAALLASLETRKAA